MRLLFGKEALEYLERLKERFANDYQYRNRVGEAQLDSLAALLDCQYGFLSSHRFGGILLPISETGFPSVKSLLADVITAGYELEKTFEMYKYKSSSLSFQTTRRLNMWEEKDSLVLHFTWDPSPLSDPEVFDDDGNALVPGECKGHWGAIKYVRISADELHKEAPFLIKYDPSTKLFIV